MSRPSCTRRPSGIRPPAPRGMALLMAIGIIAFIAAAVVVSLRKVAAESALQAQERRKREAHFAAEAGLAEARELTRVLREEGNTNFNKVIEKLSKQYNGQAPANGYVQGEPGLPSGPPNGNVFPWYEAIPWTPYTLAAASSGTAVDSDVTTAFLEMNGAAGRRILDFPAQERVLYRVFLVDDNDTDDRTVDSNNRVWLVSVGEVRGRDGTQPQRVIIRALITSGAVPGGACSTEDTNGAANNGEC
ncbi:hypothetical protein OWM54_15320 [Myxococcus sp. MISCRS1]|uniref:hypothetical protein n=1 Tax=Myxococcus TaxID=32 RepID=UPI00226E47B1|nr:hypothetical protein [Myxococcus sp. MISCRS1]MBZ4397769.1 hypothetical protein [Myxococcus sp. AS-1-15]MCY0998506.1 hypothetical protein [Myxococcus sp. MISCRS1]BDT31504.1 type II secretion system GspH family protein [Myxococcus sp. MH1]